jgi:hypothetical protein
VDPRLVLVFVVDGLRPDSVTPEDTPTLYRLRAEGVQFTRGHAVFPTVTRVNAAAIATGTQPGTNGLVGNQMYVPAVDDRRAFDIAGEDGLDGRVLAEALDGGPDPERVAVETRVHAAAAGAYRAALQISTVDGRRYVDKSWRLS